MCVLNGSEGLASCSSRRNSPLAHISQMQDLTISYPSEVMNSCGCGSASHVEARCDHMPVLTNGVCRWLRGRRRWTHNWACPLWRRKHLFSWHSPGPYPLLPEGPFSLESAMMLILTQGLRVWFSFMTVSLHKPGGFLCLFPRVICL